MFIRLTKWMLIVLSDVWLTPQAQTESENVARLQNTRVGVVFDLLHGTYDLVDTATGQMGIQGAHAEIAQWNSTDIAYTRKAQTANVASELSRGGSLTVECVAVGKPLLLLEFTLHPSFVELRVGLKNTTAEPVRIRQFKPLAGGVVFPGSVWSDVRTLDAPSGANQPTVTTNAVRSSANNLLLTFKQSGIRRSLILGALKTADFMKWEHLSASRDATLEANDPVGKLVEPGETYIPEDSFYMDVGTANPFEALEQYGRHLRAATGANPNLYDFPTVCAWYAGVWKTKGAQDHPDKSTYKINTTTGLVEEAQKMQECGFMNYSRTAGRLVPDNYTTLNPQGWWDDEHWRLHGFYTAPYETSVKFSEGMHRYGALAFTYIQPTCRRTFISRDFRVQNTRWLCAKDLNRTLDYSQPEVQAYLCKKFGALRGHIDGLMVDYCDNLWQTEASQGGFADPHMTSTAFYRQFFRCVKDGLGSNSWLHERCIHHPNNDLTLGITDSQRTSGDTDKISPAMVSRSGLRWYKNRVVLSYDMDSKELTSAWKVNGWTGSDRDGRRMLLTMAYVAASRLLLANSFRDITPEILHDLERTFPYPTEPRSARPVDAFTHTGWPRVYDFAVSPDWHQVTLFNNTLPTREETIAVALAGDTAEGALGLDPRQDYYVYDFWNDQFVGKLKGTGTLRQVLRPGEARMLSVHKVERHPQFLSTNRHLMQGHLDLDDMKWDGHRLTGKAKVVAGELFKIVIALNGHQPENLKISDDGQFAVLTIERPKNETLVWGINFK